MAKPGAFVLKLTRDREIVFRDALDEMEFFAEAVPSFSHSRNAPLVCFVVNSRGRISHIANGRRGVNAGTYQSRLNLSDIEALQTRLTAQDIIDGVPARNRKAVQERFKHGGLLSPKAFEEVVDLVARRAPETARSIDRFSKSTRRRLAQLNSETREALGAQKESVATAMLLAGIDRAPLREWMLGEGETPESFLDGLSESRQREDEMIVRDLSEVPGYDYLRRVPNASAALFVDKETGRRLTVILANRLPLEEQTGTDLIYYNEAFKSFVLVQYKAMESDDKEGAIFRFPEKKLSEEIGRMDAFLSELAKLKEGGTVDDFRLSHEPFFLKFCPRTQFDPDSSGVTKGMYVPLSYWKRLAHDNGLVGPRGGRRLAYSNVRRYFDNSSFASMVKGAWVGTVVNQSAVIESWIRKVMETGRAITFAVKPDDRPDDEEMTVDINPDLGLHPTGFEDIAEDEPAAVVLGN
ncbi:hypothetical protein J5277_17770 [Rhizobium sp. 16-449-1b]|uniref:hypothetical protein n=1 Tax=Rhizobium sp. 16-449-1b TaxID=2819989 RepID=UPI001ADAE6D1|nr:hypothetical protein [Rhizobium sp. 16-449-1b]MBO9195954.1 hypothetical protein [Rhizobium sp. 16-449-1b]